MPGEALNASRLLTGPTGITGRFDEMRTRLQRRPIDTWADDETGYRGLTRYAFACTQPDDRLLVTWFEPNIYFYAERDFAGGHGVLRRRLARLDPRPAVHGRPAAASAGADRVHP